MMFDKKKKSRDKKEEMRKLKEMLKYITTKEKIKMLTSKEEKITKENSADENKEWLDFNYMF